MNEIQCADGGVMREVYKDPGWGQVNVRMLPPGATAGGHRHPRTNEVWILLRGALVVRLERNTDEHLMAPWQRLQVPAGVGHAVESVGKQEAVLLYWRDRLYDSDDPDKEPWDWRSPA